MIREQSRLYGRMKMLKTAAVLTRLRTHDMECKEISVGRIKSNSSSESEEPLQLLLMFLCIDATV